MAKATVFLVIFVELLSRLYCFAHAGTVAEGSIKPSHWTGTKQVTASNPSLFPNCRSQVFSLLALSFCLFVFSRWCLGITHLMLLDYLLSCCSFCLVVVVLLLFFVLVFLLLLFCGPFF